MKVPAEFWRDRDMKMAAKHLRKQYEDGGQTVERKRYREAGKAVAKTRYEGGGKAVAKGRYEEEGKVAAKRKYESGGRALSQMTYHIIGAKDADVQQHYALTKSSYFKPESLDVEQAWGCAPTKLKSVENAWYLTDAELYPPSYTATHDPVNLKAIQEFHLFLNTPIWMTCVRCFKAWFSIQKDFVFRQGSCKHDAWFSVTDSEILRRWCFDGSTSVVNAKAVVRMNPDLIECGCGATGLAAGLVDVCNPCKEFYLVQINLCAP